MRYLIFICSSLHSKNLIKELEDSRRQVRDRQQKIAELSASLITTSNERDELQTQNNRLQHKLKDCNEEFRGRLVKYVADIAVFFFTTTRV